MTQDGTVVNGAIVFDGPLPFPDGTRVRVEPADDADLWDELAAVPPPPQTETREEFLESLRQSIAEMKAGVKGIPVAEFFAELKREVGSATINDDTADAHHVRHAAQDRLTADDV